MEPYSTAVEIQVFGHRGSGVPVPSSWGHAHFQDATVVSFNEVSA